MKPVRIHSWNVSPDEASVIQINLRNKVKVTALQDAVHLVAGTAVAFDPSYDTIHAAIVILQYPGMELVEQHGISEEIRFPYVSGLLAFREGPPLMHLVRKIKHQPDVILFHAHGQAHPRRFGLASHLGVLLDVPTIGVSTRILVGQHEELDNERGDQAPIIYKEQHIGTALRSKNDVKPVYVSVGHKTDLSSAIDIAMGCVTRYRRPEPLRMAQLAVNVQKEGQLIDLHTGGNQTTLF